MIVSILEIRFYLLSIFFIMIGNPISCSTYFVISLDKKDKSEQTVFKSSYLILSNVNL